MAADTESDGCGPVEAATSAAIDELGAEHPFTESLRLIALTLSREFDAGDHSASLVRELRATLADLGKAGGPDGDPLDAEIAGLSTPV